MPEDHFHLIDRHRADFLDWIRDYFREKFEMKVSTAWLLEEGLSGIYKAAVEMGKMSPIPGVPLPPEAPAGDLASSPD